MTKQKILVIGSGGREHALCWKLAQSPLVDRVYCAPGNGGTALQERVENVAIGVMDFRALSEFARLQAINLVVVGPDNPLAEGIVDALTADGLRVFGPTRKASRLEWSKSFAKQFMAKAGIPTARFTVVNSMDEGLEAVRSNDWARVIKADGLALGKGVYVCDTQEEALEALKEIFLDKKFGDSGNTVVIEEKLTGEELSLLLLFDGKTLVELAPCQDHKRRFDEDRGPNTGGMGAYSPVSVYEDMKDRIKKDVLDPLKLALVESDLDYRGVIYVGLMMGSVARAGVAEHSLPAATPYVLEFNSRFGDPETQVIMPRLRSDLLPALFACVDGNLNEIKMEWSPDAACCVVAVGKDYPSSSSKGAVITTGTIPHNVVVYHAGTRAVDGRAITDGGRVLNVTALANDMKGAIDLAYSALREINFEGMDYRKDIGRRAFKKCLSS